LTNISDPVYCAGLFLSCCVPLQVPFLSLAVVKPIVDQTAPAADESFMELAYVFVRE